MLRTALSLSPFDAAQGALSLSPFDAAQGEGPERIA